MPDGFTMSNDFYELQPDIEKRSVKRALEIDDEIVGLNILINRIHDCHYKSLFSYSNSSIYIKYFEVIILLLSSLSFRCFTIHI